MLQNLSPDVRECLARAQEYAQRAKVEPNPTVQREFLEMERRWLQLARSWTVLSTRHFQRGGGRGQQLLI
jgi:hypothetical protein